MAESRKTKFCNGCIYYDQDPHFLTSLSDFISSVIFYYFLTHDENTLGLSAFLIKTCRNASRISVSWVLMFTLSSDGANTSCSSVTGSGQGLWSIFQASMAICFVLVKSLILAFCDHVCFLHSLH